VVIGTGSGQSAAAGTLLPDPITFVVSDGQGPLAGVAVDFALGDVTGLLSARTDTTGADGKVSVRWTVGGQLGEQILTATVGSLTPARATAAVTVGPPLILSIRSNPSQFVVAGRIAPSAPSIRLTDGFSNPIVGATVTFADATDETEITGGTQVTDQTGAATATSWRLPNRIATFILTASSGQLSTTFAAFSIPARFDPAGGNNQTNNAGTEVGVAPTVIARDDNGDPMAQAAVNFTIESGGGQLLGTTQSTTGANGVATAPRWILGLTPGLNRLKAEVAGVAPLVFEATGLAAVPAAIAAVGPTSQPGLLGNFTSTTPVVRVTDGTGHPVAGATVTFTVTSGDGSVRGNTPSTDFRGEASLGAWRLGGSSGPQSLTAEVAGLPAVTYTATATAAPPSAYRIDLKFLGPAPSASQKEAFDSAAARWSRIVLGDLGDEPFTPDIDMSFCGGQPLSETVDDLVIFAKVAPIDGKGKILGQAGVCYIRDNNLLPVVGLMQFDSDDVVDLEAAGQFRVVVLHEMGHLLGIGSLWDDLELLVNKGGSDPFFRGSSARASFLAALALGGDFGGNRVPVENSGGPGTRDSHWRETVLGNELMTGFLNAGATPLSAITASSLRDEGYLVNDVESDGFTFAAAIRAISTPSFKIEELPWTQPIRTVSGGVVRRIRFR
jgi:hypothetical protein